MSKLPFFVPAMTKTVEVLTTPIAKKSNVLIPHAKKDIEEKPHVKQPIKNLFMGAANDIPVLSYYVDSMGDLNMYGKIGESSLCETTNKGDFTISANGTITFIDAVYVENTDTDTDETEVHVTKKRNISAPITGDIVTLCSLTYGDARKIFRNHITNKVRMEGIFDYVAQNKDKIGGGLIYEGVLVCSNDKVEEATLLIKDMLKEYSKHTICWE